MFLFCKESISLGVSTLKKNVTFTCQAFLCFVVLLFIFERMKLFCVIFFLCFHLGSLCDFVWFGFFVLFGGSGGFFGLFYLLLFIFGRVALGGFFLFVWGFVLVFFLPPQMLRSIHIRYM